MLSLLMLLTLLGGECPTQVLPEPTCVLEAWVEPPPNVVKSRYLLKACGEEPPFFCCDEDCNGPECTATPIPGDEYSAIIKGTPGVHVVNVRSAEGGGHFFVTVTLPSLNE